MHFSAGQSLDSGCEIPLKRLRAAGEPASKLGQGASVWDGNGSEKSLAGKLVIPTMSLLQLRALPRGTPHVTDPLSVCCPRLPINHTSSLTIERVQRSPQLVTLIPFPGD